MYSFAYHLIFLFNLYLIELAIHTYIHIVFAYEISYLLSFTLADPEDVTAEEISRVREMIKYLDACRALLPDTKLISDDDGTCTICYAFPIAATFKPCNHRSCRTCIDRHLLNTRECFFCKAIISKVEDLSGNILHDFTSELTRATS